MRFLGGFGVSRVGILRFLGALGWEFKVLGVWGGFCLFFLGCLTPEFPVQVPAFEGDDGFCVFESNAIAYYGGGNQPDWALH